METQIYNSSPSPGKARPRAVTIQLRRKGGGSGGWSGAGERTNQTQNIIKVHGGVDGGRSQGEARSRRSQMKTQATVMMVAHGGADGVRSHGGGVTADSIGPTNGSGAGGDGARGGLMGSGGDEGAGSRGGAAGLQD